MCGITGIITFKEQENILLDKISLAVKHLNKRGPDSYGIFQDKNIALGHARLSIIDTSNNANQPFTDDSGRYTIVFNGEFFNFQDYKQELLNDGVKFRSTSDTEVLLYLYIKYRQNVFSRINGFFAFAIYDNQEKSLFVTRDRYGVKPFLYYFDGSKFVFASEMKSIMSYGLKKELDNESLFTYLQLNYIPSPNTIFKNIKKLEPGNFILVKNENIEIQEYYSIEKKYLEQNKLSYEGAQKQLVDKLDNSVRLRLISDVPLGAFLSGGVDSSVIVALASRYTKHLNTFSIGYKDEKYFDETEYANLVAKKFNTNHSVFSLTNADLYEHLYNILDYIDEPFADSSSIAVYVLSHYTRKYCTVALSGDGGDELFGGYNKHLAQVEAQKYSKFRALSQVILPVLQLLPKSRNSKITDKFRKIDKFARILALSNKEQYFSLCSFATENYAKNILSKDINRSIYQERKQNILQNINNNSQLNDILYTDMDLVLQNDMLTKVDLMSMANSLEVRTPFLDYNLVDFAFSIPNDYKIKGNMKKRILQDSFRNILPNEIYNRPKHGFEVPLTKWLQNELQNTIENELLSQSFVEQQGIFNYEQVDKLKKQLFSSNLQDAQYKIWALIVFQYWWKKNF